MRRSATDQPKRRALQTSWRRNPQTRSREISFIPHPRRNRSDLMEKKDLLGVRKKTAAKRRRKVVPPGKSGGGAGRLAQAIANYLAFDSYMYAPLVSDDPPLPAAAPSQPPATAAPPSAPPEKETALVQKYRGSWRANFTAC